MKSRVEFDKSIIILIIIAAVIAVTVFIIMRNTRTDQITEMIENNKGINAVFLVHDGDQLLFTEIFFYNPETGKGALLDVPGETGVIIKKLGRIDRIDRLYSSREPDEYISAVEEMVEQEIHFYIEIELEKLSAMVDIVEGLEMFVANPIEIIDNEQIVLLPSGSIILDGDKAMSFVTYKHSEETEIDESGRREKVIQSLLKAFQQQGQMLTSDKLFPHFRKTIKTNAESTSVKSFIREMENLDTSRMVFQRILGVRRTVDDQILLFSHYDGNLLRETVRQTITSLANIEVVSDEELNISIEILNGTGVNGLASRTSQVFQSFGYDVAHIGNHESAEIEKTKIIDRRGDIAQAQRVASIIKCSNVESAADNAVTDDENYTNILTENIDLVILLGKDFDGRYCKD
ncbi:MAG: LCP family protein [Spirochaetales bacterium]|nr:LCP family protein [Spirochaetales bacterium]